MLAQMKPFDPLAVEPTLAVVREPGGRFARTKPTDQLSRKEAALFLQSIGCPISARSLERMAFQQGRDHFRKRKGPPFTQFLGGGTHGRPYYLVSDLIAWAKRNMRRVE